MPKAERSMPAGVRPASLQHLHQRMDHVAARRDREDVDLRIPVGALALGRSHGGRARPGREASGSRPARGSGPPHPARPDPRSAAAAVCGRRRAGWRSRARTVLRELVLGRRDRRAPGSARPGHGPHPRARPRARAARSPCAPTARSPAPATSVAAMLPDSMSRPTRELFFFTEAIVGGCLASSPPSAATASCAIPKTDESGLANECVQVGVDELIARQQGHDAAQRQERPEWHRQLPGSGAPVEHHSHPDQGAG